MSVGVAAGSRGRWAVLGLAWLIALVSLLPWALRTPPVVLRGQLKTLQFWSLEGCVGLGLVIGIPALRRLRRELVRSDAAALIALAALAAALTLFVPPRTNRIFYDEQIYQNIGQNLADVRLAQMCNDGAVVQGRLRCFLGEYNKQPYAYPHLLSLAYRLFGVGAGTAFRVNAAVMTVTVVALYVLVVTLFEDRIAAFLAALAFTLNPEQLLWSASAASEPSASLACVSALLAAACFVRWRTTQSLVGAAVATAYAVQFRPESVLVIPVVALLLWQNARDELARPRVWWAALFVFLLLAVDLGHMAAVRNEGWGTTDARFSLGYIASNLRSNGWFYLADRRFPAFYTLLALAGLAWPRADRGRLTLLAYFLAFFGIALLFYAGSYDYGADVRYSLATFPPLMALAGLGGAGMVRLLRGLTVRRLGLAALIAVVVFQFVWYAPVATATTDSAWAARADVEFARSLVPGFGRDSYVLTHNPGMFQVWGVNAGQMSLAATNPAFLDDAARKYPGGVFVHWNFWCNVQDPIQPKFCTDVLGLAASDLVREHRERDQRYALYRLRLPRLPP